MKKENILIVALISIILMGFIFYNYLPFRDNINSDIKQTDSTGSDTSQIGWNDYAKGMKIAQRTGNHIFLYFYADWCGYCEKLKQTTFKDKKVLNYLEKNFVSILVDTDKNKELANQWKVRGLPTLWFLEQDGSKINNIPGYVEPDQFLRILKFIHSRNYENMSFKEFSATL